MKTLANNSKGAIYKILIFFGKRRKDESYNWICGSLLIILTGLLIALAYSVVIFFEFKE